MNFSPIRFFRQNSWLFVAPGLVLGLIFGILWLSGSRQIAAGDVGRSKAAAEYPNYDIRTDKRAGEQLERFRKGAGKTAVDIADLRDTFVRGEANLKQKVRSLKVEYTNNLGTPEIIAPDVTLGKAILVRPTGSGRVDTLRGFLSQNLALVGAVPEQVAELKVAADYTNPDGRLSFVELDQEINGIPVFQGGVKAGFNSAGEMVRVINNLAPLDTAKVSGDFGDPADAVIAAERLIGRQAEKFERPVNYTLSTDLKAVFGEGDSATAAEKMYFPTEPGVVVPAWRVLIWQPVNSYYVIVDAQTGTMLWRKNITDDQTQPAIYYVYRDPSATVDLAHNPYPLSPAPSSPNGAQGTAIKRLPVQRVGNEAPYTFNDLGWITDGGTKTDGNAIQAGLDRDGVDGIDMNSEAVSATRVFKYDFRPFDPNGGTLATQPIPSPQTYPGSAFQQGSVTQLFYTANLWHDEMYLLGFNEQAKNFQHDNFGRGGLGDDRVRGEGQDSSGTNNANFTTPADGTRPKMQMYMWTAPTPDIDSNFDAEVVLHENTHGMSQRLHGNASGLQLDLARGMGEGWSDFFALCLLSKPTDPIGGIYAFGTYDTYLYASTGTNNNYYGIRRFPTAIMSTVGPNGKPHNPLTFQDIDATKIDLSDGAYPPAYVGTADQVHNIGEVWSVALWEIRARMMQRLGNAVGNKRVMQFVVDGMKLAPLNPTPITERDAMVSAVVASGTAEDVADIWAGFALRGFGASASIQAFGGNSTGGLGTVRVTEAFDLPNLTVEPIVVSDADGNGNGFPDPGETVILTIPLKNETGLSATGTTLELVGAGTQNYGTITHGATVSRNFTYTVPAGASCGDVLSLALNATSSLGPRTFTRTLAVGSPVTTFSENFDAVTPPAVPANWTVTSSLPAMTFVSTAASSDSAPNSMFAADPTTTGGSTELTSPVLAVGAQAAVVTFRHRYNSEPGWDGGVLEISIAGGAWQDIVTAGGTFLQNGYDSYMATSGGNPISGRFAWTGDSGTYVTTVARMPAAAAGQNIQLRWRFGADNNTAPVGGGWNVDTISFAGSFSCSAPPLASVSGRVVASDGRGLRNAKISLTDSGGSTVSRVTGAGGAFAFSPVEGERSYVISVGSRRYAYSPVQIKVAGDISGLVIVPASVKGIEPLKK